MPIGATGSREIEERWAGAVKQRFAVIMPAALVPSRAARWCGGKAIPAKAIGSDSSMAVLLAPQITSGRVC
jgi:hypothetical protein